MTAAFGRKASPIAIQLLFPPVPFAVAVAAALTPHSIDTPPPGFTAAGIVKVGGPEPAVFDPPASVPRKPIIKSPLVSAKLPDEKVPLLPVAEPEPSSVVAVKTPLNSATQIDP